MIDTLKCVVIGDGAIGKTSLLITYTHNHFPNEYMTHYFEDYSVRILFEEQPITLMLWDTAGQEEYDRLRPLIYHDTNVFLMCYAINSPNSFAHITARWKPEVELHCPNVPFVLVGTKLDTREEHELASRARKHNEFVSFEQGMDRSEEIGAFAFREVSAKTQTGLKELFETAIRAALEPPKKSKKRKSECTVM